MSDFFKGVTFPWQEVTAVDDAIARRAALPDRRLSGCELSYAGYTLTMGVGSMLICGRQFRHTKTQSWSLTGATAGYARLLLTIDVTKASTEDAFEQISASVEYATAADGFAVLRQDDINSSGTAYQAAVCIVALSSAGITGIVDQMILGQLTAEELGARHNTWMPTAEEVGAAPAIEDSTHPGCYYRMVDGVQEWINPPLVLGVEYRTTKRHNGNPVYVKSTELDLSVSGSKHVGISRDITNVVSIEGCLSSINDKKFDPIAAHSANITINSYGNLIFNVTENSVAYPIVEYTK